MQVFVLIGPLLTRHTICCLKLTNMYKTFQVQPNALLFLCLNYWFVAEVKKFAKLDLTFIYLYALEVTISWEFSTITSKRPSLPDHL